MPYYLLHSLNRMDMQVNRNKNKETSIYHHGFIKIMVDHQPQQQGESWNIFFLGK